MNGWFFSRRKNQFRKDAHFQMEIKMEGIITSSIFCKTNNMHGTEDVENVGVVFKLDSKGQIEATTTVNPRFWVLNIRVNPRRYVLQMEGMLLNLRSSNVSELIERA